MKRFLNFTVVYFFISTFGQSADIPDLIPKSINKKTGYIDQKGNVYYRTTISYCDVLCGRL